ncbi:MAG: hypothetical protein Q8S22_08040 [Eubacteriales bacterium]|jgi:hypothetical protein|nr:hypothetical protein [Eubacteriales bacterium]
MKRREKRACAWEDDGRTIVNMNVEGMPGYRRELDGQAVYRAPEQERKKEQLSPRETRMILLASMKWAFLFSAGFSLILVLFVLFCIKVWFA